MFSLGSLGVALDPAKSYTLSFSAFVNNLTSLNSSVLVSLYDGTNALGAVTLPPQDGIWAEIISAPTLLNGDAALNFPSGAPFVPGAEHNPSQAVMQAAVPYSSRRISSDLQLFRVNNSAYNSLFASDPEAPLAQVPRVSRFVARSAGFPLTPSVSASRGPIDVFNTGASNLRVVVWSRDGSAVGVTAMAVVVDEATVGCDGIDHVGPPPVNNHVWLVLLY